MLDKAKLMILKHMRTMADQPITISRGIHLNISMAKGAFLDHLQGEMQMALNKRAHKGPNLVEWNLSIGGRGDCDNGDILMHSGDVDADMVATSC